MDRIFYAKLGQKCASGGSSGGSSGGGGDEGWIGDGNTHIWISLAEGRTSPCLGVGVKGTVTVDWGDGSEPDTLSGGGSNTTTWTQAHEYSKAGDYVITLSGDEHWITGSSPRTQLLRFSAGSDDRSYAYYNAIRKVELGENAQLNSYALGQCNSLTAVKMHNGVKTIPTGAFSGCTRLVNINIHDGVTTLGDKALSNTGVISVKLPDSITSIGSEALGSCDALASVNIPDGVTKISYMAFNACYSLTLLKIPSSVTSIEGYSLANNKSITCYDFSQHTAVPALAATSAFNSIAVDCEIRVPAALYDEWIAATNWSAIAAKYTFVGV